MGMLKDYLAISGHQGLFKFISQGRNGVIVESLDTKKRMNVPSSAKMSALEDIAIYTVEEEVPLEDVLKKIHDKEEGKKCINHKADNADLKAYFKEVLPEFDEERVYISDIKKVLKWYLMLHEMQLLHFEEAEEAEEEKEVKEPENKEEKEGKNKSSANKEANTPKKDTSKARKDTAKKGNTTRKKTNPSS